MPNTKPGIPKIAVPRSEPIEYLVKVSDKETNGSHEILALLAGFISQPSVPKTEDDGNEKHPWWNKSSSEPQRTDENLLNDDYNAVEDITKKFESFPALQNDTDHHRDSESNTASTWGKDKKTPAVQECEETGKYFCDNKIENI